MGEKKRKDKWVQVWVKDNIDKLVPYRGLCVTLHPEHGIVCIARDVLNAIKQVEFLRRSIAAECVHCDVFALLKKAGWKDPFESQAPFDVAEREKDKRRGRGKDKPREAKVWKRKRKVDDPVPQLKDPPADPHNGLPDLSPLAPPIDLFDNGVVLDGASNPSVAPEPAEVPKDPQGWSLIPSGSAFPSPHKQPSFQPRTGGFDRGILIDGAGRSIRGPRYD